MKPEQVEQFVIAQLEELKAFDIVSIDVRKLTSLTEYMVFCSGRAMRHVKAIAENLVEKSKKQGLQPLGVEGLRSGEWVVVDLNDVIVHVMLPEIRAFYDIESLWDLLC